MTPVLDCPRCGAHARGEAQWCSLCYAELRPEPEVAPPVEPVVAQGPSPRGRHARRASSYEVPIPELASREAQDLAVDAMLAQLAADSVRPFPGLAGRFQSKGARVGIVAGGIVGFAVVMILLMVLVGSLL